MKEVFGTPYYVAPEVLLENYNEKADIWSIGVIAFMLLSGKVPFSGKNMDQIFTAVKKGQPSYDDPSWSKVSPAAKNFVKKLLVVDVKKRYSVDDCLNDAWIQKAEVDKGDLC